MFSKELGQKLDQYHLLKHPFYQVYLGAATLSGAAPVFVPSTQKTNFLPDFHSLDPEVLNRTALAYYCTPANPQGTAASLETLTRNIELARKYDFVIVFDECYSEIYNDRPPSGGIEACAALGGSLDHVLIMNSLSTLYRDTLTINLNFLQKI